MSNKSALCSESITQATETGVSE